eukprot:scaffold294302_cov31-Prasinocladus_malaysianus.AAC.1
MIDSEPDEPEAGRPVPTEEEATEAAQRVIALEQELLEALLAHAPAGSSIHKLPAPTSDLDGPGDDDSDGDRHSLASDSPGDKCKPRDSPAEGLSDLESEEGDGEEPGEGFGGVGVGSGGSEGGLSGLDGEEEEATALTD